MQRPVPTQYALGEFLLDADARKLSRAGSPVRLTNLPLRVLLYLVEHRDRVVTRGELLERFWEGRDVYDDTLHQCVRSIRRALGDSASSRRFVETFHGEGYRYVGPVQPVAPSAVAEVEVETGRGVEIVLERGTGAAAAARYGWASVSIRTLALAAALLAAVAAAAVLATRSGPPKPAPSATPLRSVAVLAFENLSGDPDEEYLCDGLADTLISDLSRINNLKVISRRSAFAFKGQAADAREIGRRLGVAAVLEGSVRRQGETVQVQVRLVSTEDNRVLWTADSLERPSDEVLDIQENLTCQLVSELRVHLCGEGERVARRYTRNPAAFRAYLQGRYYWNRRTGENMRRALDHYSEAVRIDPSYALGYAGLAETYALMEANGQVPPRSAAPEGEANARKALELDDSLPGAWAALGLLRYCAYDWPEGERLLRRAIDLNPGYATARQWYANGSLVNQGRFEEGEAELLRAWESDPLSYPIATSLAELYYYWRRYDRAVEQARAAVDLSPGPGNAWWVMAQAYRALGRNDEALAAAERSGFDGHRWLAIHLSGRRDEERRYADESARSSTAVQRPYTIACLYAWLGERDETLRWLERAYAAGQNDLALLVNAPEYDFLRSDPRYVDLVGRLGLPVQPRTRAV